VHLQVFSKARLAQWQLQAAQLAPHLLHCELALQEVFLQMKQEWERHQSPMREQMSPIRVNKALWG
jgi:hypothetical protein